jgi:preprotein translocase subunit SecY
MLASIINTFVNCFKIPELRSRILFTLVVLAICRAIAIIPIPGLDARALMDYLDNLSKTSGAGGSLFEMYSLFTGRAVEHCAIGTLGIMPYISATIIIQLLGAVVPTLSKLAREEGGRAKIVQYGRYLTVLLCLGQGYVMALGWEHPQNLYRDFQGVLVLYDVKLWYRIQTLLVLTGGTLLLMWLGEQISERGIGNGVSLVITIGILARLPDTMRALYLLFFPPGGEAFSKVVILKGIALVCLLLGVVAAVIAVTQAQRKIPVQHAQRAIGRKVISGGSSFMPLRVNHAGVMPIIFAQAILMFPHQILDLLGKQLDLKFLREIAVKVGYGEPLYVVIEALMIVFFSYFWVATQFNEIQVADDLKKSGGYIPGVRPGQATSDFLHRTMSRVTLAGALFLAGIAIFPVILSRQMGVSFNLASFFGGTSILITVGVMLDTLRQMEAHLLMRHYDGFLKKSRVRGRF